MGRYLIRRFAELILTVFLIATATFFLLEAVPGDPFNPEGRPFAGTDENCFVPALRTG